MRKAEISGDEGDTRISDSQFLDYSDRVRLLRLLFVPTHVLFAQDTNRTHRKY